MPAKTLKEIATALKVGVSPTAKQYFIAGVRVYIKSGNHYVFASPDPIFGHTPLQLAKTLPEGARTVKFVTAYSSGPQFQLQ